MSLNLNELTTEKIMEHMEILTEVNFMVGLCLKQNQEHFNKDECLKLR